MIFSLKKMSEKERRKLGINLERRTDGPIKKAFFSSPHRSFVVFFVLDTVDFVNFFGGL